MGNYTKDPKDNRTRLIRIRVTEEEYQDVVKLSEEIGISISTLGRVALKKACKSSRDFDFIEEASNND